MSSKRVKAVAVQIKPVERSVNKTIQHAVSLATRAARKEADIICLPEHWLPEQKIPSPVNPIPELQSLAEQYAVAIIGGAFFERVNRQVRLSSPIIGPDGSLLGRQFKVHLFRSEHKLAKPGNTYNLFRINNYKIGVLVCYDVDFPEPSRIYALKGAELIACPSRIVRPGIKPWQEYLTVRCLENRIPIIAPNVYSLPYFDGHSTILSLEEDSRTHISFPKLTSLNHAGEGILLREIDLDFHNHLRKERFADRRPETYD